MELRLLTSRTDLASKYVIVRSSFNIPLEEGKPRNLFRLLRALPTLEYLRAQGARTIVISHIGRKDDETLYPVFKALESRLPLTWGGPITAPEFSATHDAMNDGDIVLCENLRQDGREEENDVTLASLIASFGEVYVNDGFAEAHRAHVSTVGVATLLPAYAGITLAQEVVELAKAMVPQHPSLFLLGGAKFETKMPLVEKYLANYDQVFIGGALVHDIMKARGYEVGTSLVSDVSLVGAPFLNNPKLIIPIDVVVLTDAGERAVRFIDAVQSTDKIMDAGPKTMEQLVELMKQAKTVLWNGPFGNYEAGFVETTELTAQTLAEVTAFSVVGGGDTVAAIEKLGLNDNLGFVSIGGGAMLTYLEHGSTEAIDLLKK
ncbi:phosphoglycerate kinase [Patescibacteria group bacterium]|nr:phosphoglycerate kinase [Patescibacteria group bacterium]